MAKKEKISTARPKLDLGATLYAIDLRDKDYYNRLSDDDKKQYAALVLMRFVSSAPNQGGLHEYHLDAVNEVVNKDFWTLSKHPELQHKLLTVCGMGKKMYHGWIPMSKRQNANKIRDFFNTTNPGLSDLEFDILLKEHTKDTFKDLLHEYGTQDKEVKELLEQFKKVTDASNE